MSSALDTAVGTCPECGGDIYGDAVSHTCQVTRDDAGSITVIWKRDERKGCTLYSTLVLHP